MYGQTVRYGKKIIKYLDNTTVSDMETSNLKILPTEWQSALILLFLYRYIYGIYQFTFIAYGLN